MKKAPKKLSLGKETLKVLDDLNEDQLSIPKGGYPWSAVRACPTRDC